MRTLDTQLKNVEDGEKEPNTRTNNAEINPNGDSLMSDEDADDESLDPKYETMLHKPNRHRRPHLSVNGLALENKIKNKLKLK